MQQLFCMLNLAGIVSKTYYLVVYFINFSGHGEKDILLSNLFFQIMSKFKVLNFDQTPIVNTIILQFSNMLFLILNLLEQSYRLNFTLVDE